MNIRITKAAQFVKDVVIQDERAVVGAITEVSDEFVRRLETEFPHIQFEKNPQPETQQSLPADTAGDDVLVASDKTSDKKGAGA